MSTGNRSINEFLSNGRRRMGAVAWGQMQIWSPRSDGAGRRWRMWPWCEESSPCLWPLLVPIFACRTPKVSHPALGFLSHFLT